MRLDHPILVKVGMLITSLWVRAVHATMDIAFVLDDPQADPFRAKGHNIYAFWHEMLMLPAATHGRFVTALVSRHRDGDLIALVLHMVRGRTIRGSTTRGGAASVRELIREGRVRHLAITPDGPRGPRRVVQLGTVYLASRARMPIFPLGIAYNRCRRAKSWDRMAVPRPFARARVVCGQAICIPPEADRAALARARQTLQDALEAVQARAEALAAGRVPGERLIPYAELMRLYPG